MGYAVFLGDVARDEYYSVDQFPVLGEKIGVQALPAQTGGMIANAACVYASYGGNTKFLSVLNPRDRDLCQDLENYKVDTSLVLYDDSLPDSKCMIFLSQEEHTVFIVSMGDYKVELTQDAQRILCGADLIYSNFCELIRMRLGDMDCEEILRQWREHGVKLVCDIDVDHISEETARFLPYTEILFMNRVGFRNLCGSRPEADAVSEILNAGVKLLVVTLADAGCAIYENGKKTEITGIKADVVDVTGAGDTFCSTFAYCYSRLGDPVLAGNFANYAASASITGMGARSGAVGSNPVLNLMLKNGLDITPYEALWK